MEPLKARELLPASLYTLEKVTYSSEAAIQLKGPRDSGSTTHDPAKPGRGPGGRGLAFQVFPVFLLWGPVTLPEGQAALESGFLLSLTPPLPPLAPDLSVRGM